MRIAASAPTRIDLAGGTIDIWPLYLYHEGAQTLNAAISLRAHCWLGARQDSRLRIVSEDTGVAVEVEHWSLVDDSGELRLIARILRHFRAAGLDVVTRSDSPVGAGLGGSSALNIALCGALARWQGTHASPEELLSVARDIEAQTIEVPTGAQDYLAALYGGVATIELAVGSVRRVALDLSPPELEDRIVLAYTGASRNSGINNWEVFKRHINGDPDIFQQFDRIQRTARAMRAALERRDWIEAGRQIAAEWEYRTRLAPGVTTPAIDRMIAAARAAGAAGAKICGAGGGGCLIAFGEPDRRASVQAALEAAGARILDYQIESEGLRIDVHAGERPAAAAHLGPPRP